MMEAMTISAPIRSPCPPGACTCGREPLLELPDADIRILLLTRQEEKRLLDRLENLQSLADLEHLQRRMFEQLGIRVDISPGDTVVKTMLGIEIRIQEFPGLCRKTQQSIPAAIRRGLKKNPQVAFDLLNAHDLLRGT